MPTKIPVTSMLAFLAVLDLVLSVWAWTMPELWFRVWHGAGYVDPQALLPRCAANWTAFFLVQLMALLRWRREAWWLAVVAGVRLSDVFTDTTCSLLAGDVTLAARVLFPLTGAGNLVFALLLLRAYLAIRSPAVAVRESPPESRLPGGSR